MVLRGSAHNVGVTRRCGVTFFVESLCCWRYAVGMSLYVVATPIGNMEDLSARALRILREVDVVLCEDTRVTRKLLTKQEIHTPCEVLHQHAAPERIEHVVRRLQEGVSMALVVDAGTPGISDPGWQLVDAARERAIDVQAVPGPDAMTAAISVSGINCARFVFMGFPPVKKRRNAFFDEVVSYVFPVVLYESPYRVRKTLEALAQRQPQRRMVLARELTKLYEEVLRGTPKHLLEYLPEQPKGEYVLILDWSAQSVA